MSQPAERSGLEVAVIGCAGRFPGARSVAEFWRNIRDGVESIRVLSDEELLAAGVDAAALRDPNYVKVAAPLDDIELIDAGFFGLTPREAETMDPQQRLFLEAAWNALEVAGYDPARCPGPVGVYGGVSSNTYLLHNLLRSRRVVTDSLPVQFGNMGDYVTTRVSYKLNLKGPSFDVQTSCSSSLVAVHLAAQALIAGECDLALAGGASVNIPHGRGYTYQEQGIYSPDGHCRAFAADAQGTVGGNGVALVVLRRLQDAIDAGDTISAVILGSSINNDGSDKVGYAAPSVTGQSSVIRNAQTMAEVSPDSIGYIETHGTGTSLGDPIEVAALTAAFRAGTDRKGYCAIGSVKTNIGHLDAAAGVTGLIKATLALEHKQLPPSLNCTDPNPAIDFPSTPFRVNTELQTWDSDAPRRAGVSSFGIGGTNAHVVLEEAPDQANTALASRQEQLLVLSARSASALDQASANLAEHLLAHPDLELADVAHTLAVGRAEFDHRLAVIGGSAQQVADALGSKDRARVRTQITEPGERPAVFLFPGQGAQYVGMGRELYAGEAVFREHVDRACELLAPELGLDLRELLFPQESDAEAAAEQLQQTAITQPALFVIEHALAQLWMSWGVAPEAMIGHSIGEYVAATLAGVFTLEDGLKLVAARGRMMQELPPGDMLAVPLPAAEVEPLLESGVSLAAINEPRACVASGTPEAVAALEQRLKQRDVACRTLRTSHAFHSAMMDPIVQSFTKLVASVPRATPKIPFVSTMTGTWITDAEATDPEYWARHLRQPVRFADGMTTLLAVPQRVYLELGPGNTLCSLGTRIARGAGGPASVFAASMRHPREELSDATCILRAAGQAWAARVSIDWSALEGGAARRRVPLPTYPFERQRYWIEPDADGGAGASDAGKRADIADWFYLPSWMRSIASLDHDPVPDAERVLVLADEQGLGDALVERLRARGKQVVIARAGTSFEALPGGELVLNPARREDYSQALATFAEAPGLIVHLWSVGEAGDERARDTERGLLSLVSLAQAVQSRGWTEPLRIDVVSTGTQSVTGREILAPDRAMALGACQSVTQECANITCRSIDLDEAGADRVDDLMRELACRAGDATVAWRDGQRWVRRYEPVRIEESTPPLREQGHYLVIGGLGSIGLEVAACLAAAPDARLVLTGRSSFPDPDGWDEWCSAHDEDDETAMRIRKLREIEASGAQVWVARGDATDAAQMAAVLAEAERRFGPLNGVVHAAGAEKVMGILADADAPLLDAQLAAKREGLVVLESLLAERSLDFVLAQSSLSSCLGALGMVGYVAAHHWVDAFVARHNSTHAQRWISANWDNWLSWKEPDFAHDRGGPAYFMSVEEGAEALRRVLSLPAGTQVVVSTGDLDTRLLQWTGAGADADDGDEVTGELHERPQLESDYEAPTTPAERALVAAWGDVLGIGRIGVQDNFFELGGDSVLGLQIVSMLAQAGFGITPGQIFEHPTIAGLAAVAQTRGATTQDQGEVQGESPLLPMQRWFLEQGYPDPQHFNLPMLFEVPAGSEADQVRAALGDVVAHHDALRLRFRTTESGVEQYHAQDVGEITLDVVDVSDVPEDARDATLRERATELHTSLDLGAGPLMRAALFTNGSDHPAQMLWVIHHLLVDVVSWRVLIEDLQAALSMRADGKPVALPAKTTSFQAWGRALQEHAQSDAALDEVAHWQRLADAPDATLAADHELGADVYSSAGTTSVSLDEDTTRALLQQVPAAYETRIDEVLLTALARAWSARTGADGLLVDLEGHGRADLVEGLDLSRTVGWLTTLYPALLTLPSDGEQGEALKSIKEQVRSIPHHGLGYGVLRYLREDSETKAALSALPKPPINFLYLGQFDALGKSSSLRLLEDASGPPCSPDAPRGHELEVVGYVMGGRLRVDWSFSRNRHRTETVAQLAEDFLAELQILIEHCRAPSAGGRTPSDFPAAKVKQSDLDALISKIGRSGAGPAKPGAGSGS
jgi:non-ribosomal peptide synthase protein (TIGR01720 family)